MIQGKLVKVTSIPIKIDSSSRDIRGIINFSTECFTSSLGEVDANTSLKKSSIIYRNSLINRRDDEEDEEHRKKEIESLVGVLKSSKFNKKVFKIEVPLTTGTRMGTNPTTNQFFALQLGNSEGRLILLNGSYDATVDSISRTRPELSLKEKMEIQNSILDNRRKEDIKESRYRSRDNDSS